MSEMVFLETEKNERPLEVYADTGGMIKDYDVLKNVPTIDGEPVHGDITKSGKYTDDIPTKGSEKLLTSGAAADEFEKKSNINHSHDDRYYTLEDVNKLLAGKSEAGHEHDGRYYTEDEINKLLAGKSEAGHEHDARYYTKEKVDEMLSDSDKAGHNHDDRYYTSEDVNELLDGKSDAGHEHGDRYYTEDEVDELLGQKSNTGHEHDGRYYTEDEVDELLSQKSNTGHNHSYSELADKPLINGQELSGDTDINKIMFRRALTASDDCNSLFDDGWYVYSTDAVTNGLKNAPFANAGVIEVFGAPGNTSQKIQRAYRYGESGYTAFRPLFNSGWLSWSKIPIIKKKELQGKTTASGNVDLVLPISNRLPIAAYATSLDGASTYKCSFYKSPTYSKWFGHFTSNSSDEIIPSTTINITVYYFEL